MATVLLHDNSLNVRGTTRALLDYSDILQGAGHDTILTFDLHSPTNDPRIVREAQSRFELRPYSSTADMRAAAKGIDVSYMIKSGARDGVSFPGTMEIVHSVFQDYDPHGNSYVYVSDWLAQTQRRHVLGPRGILGGSFWRGLSAARTGCGNALKFEVLPHCCEMPTPTDDIRACLGIPDEAFLIVRHGGYETFDIPWVQSTVVQFLEESDSYFVAVNTAPFTSHSRAIFLEPTADRQFLANLLASGDLFLHARMRGESFGLSIVEALQCGVPILAWGGGADRNHTWLLDGLDSLYRDAQDLRDRLTQRMSRPESGKEQRTLRGDEYRRSNVAATLLGLIARSAAVRTT